MVAGFCEDATLMGGPARAGRFLIYGRCKMAAMAHVTQDFGVQSWCFREFKDNRKVAEFVKQIGLKRVELCGVHCSFDDDSKWNEAIASYRDAGVQITSIGVERAGEDEAANRRRFEFLKRAGGKVLNIHFNIATWEKVHPMMQKLGDEYDINVGLHNHGGYQWTGSLDAVKFVLSKCGPRIGSYLDTAWCIQAGRIRLNGSRRSANASSGCI